MTQNNQLIKAAPSEGILDRKVLQTLMASVDKEAAQVEVKDTKATRQAAWAKDLEQIPMEKIEDLDRTMSSFTERHVIERVEADGPRPLESTEVDRVATLYGDIEKIEAILAAKKAEARALIFGHLDSTLEADEDTPVGQVPGKVRSESLGLTFCREGGKRKDPTINWDALEAKLGDEYLETICDAEEIPAHIKYTPSEDKLIKAVDDGKITLEDIRAAITPGAWTTPRFVARKDK